MRNGFEYFSGFEMKKIIKKVEQKKTAGTL